MTKSSSYRFIIYIIAIIFFLSILPGSQSLFSKEPVSNLQDNRGAIESGSISERKKGTVIFQGPALSSNKDDLYGQEEPQLSELQKQARLYRQQGLEFQNIGDLEQAMSLYQKAIELDPAYAVAHNDLGIIYESAGLIERAEESYLKALAIDEHYLSVHSNLALLYEHKRDLKKASHYWQMRAKMGDPQDPWTKKARERLEDIRAVVSGGNTREQDILNLLKDVEAKKELLRSSNKELARNYFEKAKLEFQKGNDLMAFKQASGASQLDPTDKEIADFVEKVQARLLSK